MSNQSHQKLCIDCVHCVPTDLAHEPKCSACKSLFSPVDGHEIPRFCSVERFYGNQCGPNGDKWTQRKPVLTETALETPEAK